ncbi:hypothetical protein HaLaN_15498 [Haematococcus lacustris]|uniref:Uncharacterized protein n=1 Tax=Haematococcus lacustris TaxID=44745 RepID=A0A699ZJ70_HAELA|nr:hypothetical protein HaLaN_15498 [Haematococcus lacustris]
MEVWEPMWLQGLPFIAYRSANFKPEICQVC